MDIKYTFLLPAYKSAFLNEALQSIKNQTYEGFTVLVSDDCSPENIQAICAPYLNDSRFQYRRNEVNMGAQSLVSHWNFLLENCNTDYVIIASDDDIYDKEFLERIDELVEKYPKVDLFRARCRTVNEESEPYSLDRLCEEIEEPLEFLYSSFSQDRVHCIGNYVFRTDVLLKNGGFVDFPLAWFSDDATVSSCCTNGVANTKDVLFSFRNSLINISSTHRKDSKIALNKINAALCFNEWMDVFVKRVTFPPTLYYKTLYPKVCEGYIDRIKWIIEDYYSQLGIGKLVKLTQCMVKNQLLSSNVDIFIFILRWIKQKVFH